MVLPWNCFTFKWLSRSFCGRNRKLGVLVVLVVLVALGVLVFVVVATLGPRSIRFCEKKTSPLEIIDNILTIDETSIAFMPLV